MGSSFFQTPAVEIETKKEFAWWDDVDSNDISFGTVVVKKEREREREKRTGKGREPHHGEGVLPFEVVVLILNGCCTSTSECPDGDLHASFVWSRSRLASVPLRSWIKSCSGFSYPLEPRPEVVVCPDDGRETGASEWLDALFIWNAGADPSRYSPYRVVLGGRTDGGETFPFVLPTTFRSCEDGANPGA
jgi:hypothetical protein